MSNQVPARERPSWYPKVSTALFGMVHLRPLPNTPNAAEPFEAVAARAEAEAALLLDLGFDGIIIENMGDAPYLNRQAPAEIVAAMSVITHRIAMRGGVVGLQILAGANEAALAVATICGIDFIRAEGFVFGHLADEGWMNADAGTLTRYRRRLGSDVSIFCDVQKKHSSHAVTADLTLDDWFHGAEFSGAEGVIVTGRHTGDALNEDDLRPLGNCRLPVLIGSGVTPENVDRYLGTVDGVIVGSALKHNGDWREPICEQRAREMRDAVSAHACPLPIA